MRLLYVTTQSFPAPKASTVQVMQMCAAFAAAGAAVKLVARDPGPERLSAVELHRRYDAPPVFAIEQRPLPRGPRPADLFQAQAVWRERQRKSWICYSRGRDVFAPLLALRLGASALVEVHGRPVSARERWMLRLVQSHSCGGLVALSEALRAIYVNEFGFRSDRIVVAPDGVDLQRFTPPMSRTEARARCALPTGKRWVVYVGGLYSGRGLKTLFAAMQDVAANLLLVGGRTAEEIAAWRAQVQRLGVANVHFVGYQPPAAIPAYLAAADVLVMPYSWRTITPSGEDTTAWMSPLKMFEYMAAARPIVATDLPALRRVLEHERTALLAPPDDAEVLAVAIKRLLADSELATRLATAARAAVADYTWEARARYILESVELIGIFSAPVGAPEAGFALLADGSAGDGGASREGQLDD